MNVVLGSQREAAFAFFSPVIAGSAVLGPIVGGALVAADLFGTGWRLIFAINLPLGLAAALGSVWLMPESRGERRPRLDLIGAILAALGMGLLVYPLIQGHEEGWPMWTYAMIAGSLVPFALFVLWSRLTLSAGRDPLVSPGILGRKQYVTGLGAILVFYTGMMGLLLVVTLFLQFGQHFSAIHAGVTLAAFAVGIVIGAGVAAALLVPRLGRAVLQIGTVIFAGGLWWLHGAIGAHGLHSTTGSLAGPELLAGLGMGLLVGPLFDFVLAAVDGDEVGSASGLLNSVQQLAGALGTATLGTLFFSTLARDGYVAGLQHVLMAVLGSLPILLALLSALPRRARTEESAFAEPALV